MRRTRLLAALAVLIVAISVAVTSAAAKQTPKRGGSITMLEVEPTGGLDPNSAFVDSSRVPLAMIFETLVERNAHGTIVGALASSWKVTNGGRVYTFQLRKGIRFSNGSPITAKDVKFSIDRMRTGLTLKGALSGVSSVAIASARSVRVTMSSPTRVLPAVLARAGQAVILPEKVVNADKNYFSDPTVGSGPWKLTQYVPKSHMTFTANPYYFHRPYIQTIHYTFGTDQTANAAAVESGSADIANVNYADVGHLKKDPNVRVVQADTLSLVGFGLNKSEPPFNDVRVRQAFAYADDRAGKQTACWYGTGAVTYGSLLRPWDPDYTKINLYGLPRAQDLAKAGSLLTAAGWKLNSSGVRVASGVNGVPDGTPLKVTVPYESNWPAAQCHTLVLQQDLKQVGVTIEPQAYDPTTFYTQAGKGAFEMWHFGAGAANADDLYLNWFHSGGALTAVTTQMNSPTIDKVIDEALSTTSAARAKKLYSYLEHWQATNVPMLVDGYQFIQIATTKRLKGYQAPIDDDSRSLVYAWVAS